MDQLAAKNPYASSLTTSGALTRSITLSGQRVRLEPLTVGHRTALETCVRNGELWRNQFTFAPHPAELDSFLGEAQRAQDEGRELVFVTIDVATGTLVGSTRYRASDEVNRRTEIGFTFVARSWQRTYVNTEAKLLMLRHAFDVHNFERVEFITDARNEQSRAAIRRLGAEEEGVLRHHMLTRDGRPRDSVMHSIIAPLWPKVRDRLERLAQAK